MKRLHSHLTAIDQGSLILFSDFSDGGPMWTGEGPREARRAVRFSEPFHGEPAVHLAMGMWDCDGKTNQRADLRAENISPIGFDAVFRTWGDSRIARVRADWLAIGELRNSDDWDVD